MRCIHAFRTNRRICRRRVVSQHIRMFYEPASSTDIDNLNSLPVHRVYILIYLILCRCCAHGCDGAPGCNAPYKRVAKTTPLSPTHPTLVAGAHPVRATTAALRCTATVARNRVCVVHVCVCVSRWQRKPGIMRLERRRSSLVYDDVVLPHTVGFGVYVLLVDAES